MNAIKTEDVLNGASAEFAMWSDASGCSLEAARCDGVASVTYSDGSFEVTLQANSANEVTFSDVSAHVANEAYPIKRRGKKQVMTVAPGQFCCRNDSCEECDVSTAQPICIIVHAVSNGVSTDYNNDFCDA